MTSNTEKEPCGVNVDRKWIYYIQVHPTSKCSKFLLKNALTNCGYVDNMLDLKWGT